MVKYKPVNQKTESFPVPTKGMSNLVKFFLFKLGAIGVLLTGIYIGEEHSSDIRATMHNLRYKAQPAAERFHKDGYRIKIVNPTNDQGEFQTYMQYNERKIEIYEDLLPSNQTMLSGIEDRLRKMTKQEIDSLQSRINQIEESISKNQQGG